MCSQKTITNASSVLNFTLVVAYRFCLDLVKCLLIWYSKIDKSAPQLHCRFAGGTSQLMHSANRYCSTCKSVLAPSFTLLIVPYNSVYYMIITQRWVCLFLGTRQKRCLLWQKSAVKTSYPTSNHMLYSYNVNFLPPTDKFCNV